METSKNRNFQLLETLVANSDLGKINPKWKLLGLAFLLQVGNLNSSTLQLHPNLVFQACPFQSKLTFLLQKLQFASFHVIRPLTWKHMKVA